MDLQSLVKEVNLSDIDFGYCIPGCNNCCNITKAVDNDRSFVSFLVDNDFDSEFNASSTDGSFVIPRTCCFNLNNIDESSIGLCGVYSNRPYLCRGYLCVTAKSIKHLGLSVALKESFIELQGDDFSQFFFNKTVKLLINKKKLPADLRGYFVNGYKLLSDVFTNYELLISGLEDEKSSFDIIKKVKKEYNTAVKKITDSLF